MIFPPFSIFSKIILFALFVSTTNLYPSIIVSIIYLVPAIFLNFFGTFLKTFDPVNSYIINVKNKTQKG